MGETEQSMGRLVSEAGGNSKTNFRGNSTLLESRRLHHRGGIVFEPTHGVLEVLCVEEVGEASSKIIQ